MKNFGRHSAIILLVVMLVAPAGVALADQDRGERTAPMLERIEQWVSGLWGWVAKAGAQAEPNGVPQSSNAQGSPERVVVSQRIGAHMEPNGEPVEAAGIHLEPGG